MTSLRSFPIRAAVMTAALALTVTGCAGKGSSTPSPSPSTEMPTASYTPPTDEIVTPPKDIVLSNIQPDDGPAPVVAFINSAKKSIDISIYRIDADFTAIVDPLAKQAAKGIPVRVLISRQLVGQPNPPDGNADQLAVKTALEKQGIQVELSRPQFHYGHEKSIIVDAGTPQAKAMIADWNLQASYFGPNQYEDVGARGMAVLDSNPEDVKMIAAYFDANWPPYKEWPVSNRATLVWSPSGIEYSPVGNGVAALTKLFDETKTTLDIYAEYIQPNSFMLPKLIDVAKRGVKVRVVANSSGQSPEIVKQLRDAGINIRFDPHNAQDLNSIMFVHTKTAIVDAGQPNQTVFIGSQNQFLNESLESILELGVLVKDTNTIDQVKQTFEDDFGSATETQDTSAQAD